METDQDDRWLDDETDTRPLTADERETLERLQRANTPGGLPMEEVGAGRWRLSGVVESTARLGPPRTLR